MSRCGKAIFIKPILTQPDRGIEYNYMIMVEEHKKTLEAKGIDLTNDNVEKLLTVQYKLANKFFDIWVKKTNLKIITGTKIVLHNKNGNVIFQCFSFAYIYD